MYDNVPMLPYESRCDTSKDKHVEVKMQDINTNNDKPLIKSFFNEDGTLKTKDEARQIAIDNEWHFIRTRMDTIVYSQSREYFTSKTLFQENIDKIEASGIFKAKLDNQWWVIKMILK